MEIKIRKFRKSDSKICSRIIYDCVAVAKKLNQKEKEFLRNFYFSENIVKLSKKSDFFVAEKNRKIIGMGRLEKRKIATLYISPGEQRKRIGTLIINYVIKKAQKKNIKKVELEALLQSIGFYQKQGFKKIKILRKPIRCYKMEKFI
ncbi:MAG: hypothetical protein COU42_00685 [Candidatus Nealsonbacteria bacterium CG10_big_fil_rev_8_21_14_0_10_36_24]|uniref:N-acetyltransferase domain-containing protein n=2 Tax=Candidatus Nealsoniibacteriota TaxID=1817911 RepID=A0A2H0YQB2_9BACT|nr:MAG: hypothetical protein COU42_00685 [Candidatus Nealsonbacteria bacterium CG10_big_fil_rev_8_21_14_0_10_36_24]PIS39953.1 MAG: hypothetical protein COT32_02400 [Candidatus Nealsonbacteria bacterium CG08_land_8_20_14_0_20_36_22]